jgi:hypothetical protein
MTLVLAYAQNLVIFNISLLELSVRYSAYWRSLTPKNNRQHSHKNHSNEHQT